MSTTTLSSSRQRASSPRAVEIFKKFCERLGGEPYTKEDVSLGIAVVRCVFRNPLKVRKIFASPIGLSITVPKREEKEEGEEKGSESETFTLPPVRRLKLVMGTATILADMPIMDVVAWEDLEVTEIDMVRGVFGGITYVIKARSPPGVPNVSSLSGSLGGSQSA